MEPSHIGRRPGRIIGAAAILILGLTASPVWAEDYYLGRPANQRGGVIVLDEDKGKANNQDQLRRNADRAQGYAKTGETMGGIVILDESGQDPSETEPSESELQLRRNSGKAQSYSRGDAAQGEGDILIMPADGQSADAISRLQTSNTKAQIYSQGKKPCSSTGVAIGGIGEGGAVTVQNVTVIQGVNSYSQDCK